MALRRVLAMALVGTSLLAFPLAASAATPISVDVITGFQCVSGTGPANKVVIATLRTPGGSLRDRFRTMSDGAGEWIGCFSVAGVNGHDRLKVEIGNQERNIRIPRVEPEIDRVTDTIVGVARPEDVVFAEIVHFASFNQTSFHVLAVQADANGRYEFDTTGEVNLLGGDNVTVFAPHGDDTFGALVLVPHINILHATNVITGSANNSNDLVFHLTENDGTVKADVNGSSFPLILGISFYVINMYKDNGQAAYPVDTDRLTSNLASDANLRMPQSALQGDAATDMVTGQCMRNAPYALQVRDETFFGTTNSNGRLSRFVGHRLNMRRGEALQLNCMYPTGDTWARTNIAR